MGQQKIAFVTDDGIAISAHFGRAAFYEICTLDGATVVQRDRVPKPGRHVPGQEHDAGHEHGGHHDHGDMISPISDCTTLIARGMGMGAHNALAAVGIATILTDERTIDEALQKLAEGQLVSNDRRLHEHGRGHSG